MLFCATRDNVRHLHASLIERGFAAVALSGEHSQNERNQALQALRDKRARVCVATDVAARGIHVDGIGHVINYDLPQVPEDFIHRVGRTGRAGAHGTASTFSTRAERAEIRKIERVIGSRLELRQVSTAELIEAVPAKVVFLQKEPAVRANPVATREFRPRTRWSGNTRRKSRVS